MSNAEPVSLRRFAVTTGGLMALAALLGAMLGWWSAPKPQGAGAADGAGAPGASDGERRAEAAYLDPAAPPVYFYAGRSEASVPEVAAAQMRMAGEHGVHRFIVPVDLPWDEAGQAAVAEAVARAAEADPRAAVLLEVRLDPPPVWLDAQPSEQATGGTARLPYASVASAVWQAEAGARLEALVRAVESSGAGGRVMGYVLAAHEKGQWIAPAGRDRSPAMANGFRGWLAAHYADDAALAAAWGGAAARRDAAEVPGPLDEGAAGGVFLASPAERPQADFARFVSDATAAAIAGFAGRVKAATGANARVYAPYGFALELPRGDAGHYALASLLDAPVDGIVSPVSYIDRGLGGAGGPAGALSSVQYRGKEVLLADDTRTGVARDAITGSITRIEGLRAEDVHHVQQRNFAFALVHGLGVVWADPLGEGTLHDEALWDHIAVLREAYETARPPAAAGAPPPAAPPFPPTLVLAIDEASRPWLREGEALHGRLVHAACDAALRLGAPVHFALLRDVIDGRSPAAPVYLFANAFRLSVADREALHARLAREQAYAVWLYAPGYLDETASAANVSAAVGMEVAAFEGAAAGGSTYLLSGRWIDRGGALGEPGTWNPLFHVTDERADPLARYTAAEKISVAMRYLESGWTSIFVADPGLSPALLRELFSIVEQHVAVRPSAPPHFDAIYAGGPLLAIHGQQVGERTIDLGGFFDAADLIDPGIGWLQKDSFAVTLQTGETRLLRLSPAAALDPPAAEGPA